MAVFCTCVYLHCNFINVSCVNALNNSVCSDVDPEMINRFKSNFSYVYTNDSVEIEKDAVKLVEKLNEFFQLCQYVPNDQFL